MEDFSRELVDTQAEVELCPCCESVPRPLGLFAKNPEVLAPLALQYMLEDNQAGVALLDGEVTYACGRFFCRTDIPLPMLRDNSPIRSRVWVEIAQEAFEELSGVIEGDRNRTQLVATMACDVPGFPGTMGAEVLIERSSTDETSVILDCSDNRVADIDPYIDHDKMVELYRQVWGNKETVADADLELRASVNQKWKELIDKPVYRRAVTPPAGFAGIRPTEVLVSPPMDTGEEAVIATIGCSDVHMTGTAPVELVTWVRNPSDNFIKSFADFGYLSRLNPHPIKPGLLVPENPGIPDTDNKMVGWLLWKPRRLEDNESQVFGPENETVQLLEAIPIYEIEVIFAQAFGSDKLVGKMIENEVDVADLSRQPAVPQFEEFTPED